MGSKGSNTTTSVQTPAGMPWYNQALDQMFNATQTPYQGFEAAPGWNPQQAFGTEGINKYAFSGMPGAQTGMDMIQGASGPISVADIQHYADPYMNDVVAATQNDFDTQRGRIKTNIDSQAGAQGALGGNRVAVAEQLAREGVDRNEASTLAGLRSQGYQSSLSAAQQDAARKLQAGSAFGNSAINMQTAGLQGAGAQLGAGTQQLTADQQTYAANLAESLRAQGWPIAQAQAYAQSAAAIGGQMGGTTTQTGPTPNIWSQLIGAGITAAGVASKSDKRLKENIIEVGKLHDGQKVYKYNFKGDDKTQIGLLSQEVEKEHPEAVGRSAGFGTVDYDEATKDAEHRRSGGRVQGFASGGSPFDLTSGPIDFSTMAGLPQVNVQGSGRAGTPEIQKTEQPKEQDYGKMAKGLVTLGNKAKDWWNSPGDPLDISAGITDSGVLPAPGTGFDPEGPSGLYASGGGVDGTAWGGPQMPQRFAGFGPFGGMGGLGGMAPQSQPTMPQPGGLGALSMPQTMPQVSPMAPAMSDPAQTMPMAPPMPGQTMPQFDNTPGVVRRAGGGVRGYQVGGAPISSGFGGGSFDDRWSAVPEELDTPDAIHGRNELRNTIGYDRVGNDIGPDEVAPNKNNVVARANEAFDGIIRNDDRFPPRALAYGPTDNDLTERTVTSGVGPTEEARLGGYGGVAPRLAAARGAPRGFGNVQGTAANESPGTGGLMDKLFSNLSTDEAKQGLMSMGLRMMASRQGGPGSLLASIGEGGMQGMNTYASARAATAAAQALQRKEAETRRQHDIQEARYNMSERLQNERLNLAQKRDDRAEHNQRLLLDPMADVDPKVRDAMVTGIHGKEFLDVLSPQERNLIEAVGNYEVSPALAFSKLRGTAERKMNLVRQFNPEYDQNWYNLQGTTLKNFYASTAPGSPVVQARAGNTAVGHAGDMAVLIEKLQTANPGILQQAKDSGVPFLSYLAGQAQASIYKGTPSGEILNSIKALLPLYVGETAKFYSGSGGSDREKQEFEAPFKSIGLSFREMMGALRTQAHAFKSKTDPLEQEFADAVNAPGLKQYGTKKNVREWKVMKDHAQKSLSEIERIYGKSGGEKPTVPSGSIKGKKGGVPGWQTPDGKFIPE